jgi:hypothetical protein
MAHNAFRRRGDLDGKVAFAFRPAAGPAKRVYGLVKVTLGQVPLAFRVNRIVHVHHLGEEQKAQRGLGFVRVDKVGAEHAAAVGGAEELAHAAMPVNHAENAGELVALLEFLHGRFEHPQLAVIVDDELLAETVVPQAEHHVNHHLAHHVLAHDDRAGHAQVVIRVAAVHQGR